MAEILETDVIIVGGGPIGLAAAMELDAYGVRSVVIERRKYLEAPNVKCNHVSARTMEHFRRLGLATRLRDGGRSQVRKQIGAQLFGDAVLSHVQSTCIRAEALYDLMPG